MIADDRLLYGILSSALVVLLLAWLVVALARTSLAKRPGLRLGAPLAVAATVRLAVAGLFAAVPALHPLRGPDEGSFLLSAEQFFDDPGVLGEMPQALVGNLHVVYIAVQQLLLEPTIDYPLRVGHIALAVLAIAIVAIAISDLAGVRAGMLTAWVLALEPNNVFFSGILHKEAPMLLGEALVIFGGVRMFQRRDMGAIAFMALGLAIAGMTRPYAGAALGVACAGISVHSALRRMGPARRRSPQLIAGVLFVSGAAALAAPAPNTILSTVQASQNANVTDASNLRLEPVDFSSPASVAANLGSRVSAVLFRPYPWQVANTSQRFGVLGTAVAWSLVLLTLVLVARQPKFVLSRLPPLTYVVLLMTIVYALSTGNAGTGFRYRTHVLFGLTAAMATLTVRLDRKSRALAFRR